MLNFDDGLEVTGYGLDASVSVASLEGANMAGKPMPISGDVLAKNAGRDAGKLAATPASISHADFVAGAW